MHALGASIQLHVTMIKERVGKKGEDKALISTASSTSTESKKIVSQIENLLELAQAFP